MGGRTEPPVWEAADRHASRPGLWGCLGSASAGRRRQPQVPQYAVSSLCGGRLPAHRGFIDATKNVVRSEPAAHSLGVELCRFFTRGMSPAGLIDIDVEVEMSGHPRWSPVKSLSIVP